MDGYLWRVPTLLAASACSALVLFAAAVVGSEIVRRHRSVAFRIAVIAGLGALVIVSGLLLRTITVAIAWTNEIRIAYVDPGPTGYLGPVLFAAFAFLVGRRTLNGGWTTAAGLMFYGWLLIFAVANIINWCSPGWCETIGFPLAWRRWSDSMITFADDRLERFFEHARHATGAVLNLLIFAVVARGLALLSGRYFRPRQRRRSRRYSNVFKFTAEDSSM